MTESLVDAAWRTQAIHRGAPAQRDGQGIASDPEPLAWVDALSDDEFGDLLGPSWLELTGRSTDHLIPDHSQGAA